MSKYYEETNIHKGNLYEYAKKELNDSHKVDVFLAYAFGVMKSSMSDSQIEQMVNYINGKK